jgi:hypothetical protein
MTSHHALVELPTYAQQPRAQPSTDVELPYNNTDDLHPNAEGFSLPPTDRGKDAWLCLFACFMLEAMIWGKAD